MHNGVPGLVMACVAENAAWCSLVCRTHGIGTERAGSWTRTLRPAPTYHPDLITLDPSITSAEVAEQLTDRPSCSVKDSFAVLDLTEYGFERLFDAEWMAWPDPVPPELNLSGRVTSGWHQVTDVAAFRRWAACVEDDTALRPALLDDDNTHLWLLEDGAPSGFVSHRTGGVVAVTNAFRGRLDVAAFWHDCVTLANRGWGSASGGLRVVTYERGQDVEAARHAGFESLGSLTVWNRAGRPAQ